MSQGSKLAKKGTVMIPRLIAFMIAFTAMAQPALSVVITGEIIRQAGRGEFVKLDTDAPFAVGFDTFDDDNLYAFDEDQNIVLTEPIRVDIGGKNSAIAQGVTVASHYVFFDSLNGVQMGFVYFDAPILGPRFFGNI